MPDQPLPKSRRYWLRLSVRGLIVLVLVIGSWLGWRVRNARVQREAVRTIKRAGGLVWYEWEWKNGRVVPGVKPPAPPWLVRLIGSDYFGDVVAVRLNERDGLCRLIHMFDSFRGNYQRDGVIVSDATLARLGDLKNLESLALDGTLTDDSALAHLEELRHLKHLSLIDTDVTDAGLTHLKGTADLRVLRLYCTDVTDAGIRDLVKFLPSLRIMR